MRWDTSRVRKGACTLCSWVLAVLVGLAPATGVSAQESRGSLKPLYEEAQQQPDSPAGREAAIAKYQEIIELHQANQAVYGKALRGLVDAYTESGRVEEAIRLVVKTAMQREAGNRDEVLRGMVQEFQLKHADAFKKVLTELGLAGGGRPSLPQPTPSDELVDAILQRDDAQLRAEALKRLKELLAEDAADKMQVQGLVTLRKALPAKFDRADFLPLVRPLLHSKHAQVRRSAVAVLPGIGAGEQDLERVIALVDDENADVRAGVGGALIQIGQGKYAEQIIPALLELLDDDDSRVVEQTIRSMWGQYASPQFNERLIELSHNPRYHHNVIYFCLSTQQAKSVAVCRRLVDELADPDWNNSGRAAWGLTYGVSEQAKPIVEAGLLKALPEETNAYTRKQEFRALRGVATENSREYLTSVVQSELETAQAKQLAGEILADLDARAGH